MNLNRLRVLRIESNYTQKDIAKILKISQAQYCKYELGNNTMSYDKLDILASLYNTSIDYLLYRTNIKYSYPKIEKDS